MLKNFWLAVSGCLLGLGDGELKGWCFGAVKFDAGGGDLADDVCNAGEVKLTLMFNFAPFALLADDVDVDVSTDILFF